MLSRACTGSRAANPRARYYEIGTDRFRIFGDRDKTIHDHLNEFSDERRTDMRGSPLSRKQRSIVTRGGKNICRNRFLVGSFLSRISLFPRNIAMLY